MAIRERPVAGRTGSSGLPACQATGMTSRRAFQRLGIPPACSRVGRRSVDFRGCPEKHVCLGGGADASAHRALALSLSPESTLTFPSFSSLSLSSRFALCPSARMTR